MNNDNLTTKRAAALLLRWAAQLASGEDSTVITGCRVPLREAGLPMDLLERHARRMAAEALFAVDVVDDAGVPLFDACEVA